MAYVEDQLAEWKAAYRLLDVPTTASVNDIRQGQRLLLKRWHPDLFTAGSNEQVEATQMTQVINEAYAKIKNAPLRYFDQTRGAREGQRPRTKFEDKPDPFQNMERVEFWIKFGLGAAIGAFFGIGSLLRLYIYRQSRTSWFGGNCDHHYGLVWIRIRERRRQILGCGFPATVAMALVINEKRFINQTFDGSAGYQLVEMCVSGV